MQFRCPSRIHGVIKPDGLLEIKCSSKHCGAGNGVVILHQFDRESGELVRTDKYKNPQTLFQKGH